MNDFWLGFSSSVLATIIISGLIYCYQFYRYWRDLRRKYNDVGFDVYYKGDKINKVGTVDCQVAWGSRKIIYRGTMFINYEGDFKGEFILNPFNLRTGKGYHHHSEFEGYNFPRLLIESANKFLIETSFISLENLQVPDQGFITTYKAYVWRRKREISD